MFDLILFPPVVKIEGELEFFEVRKLSKNIFASSSDLEKARAIVKKVKYFHYQLYTPEQGFMKLMREHGCTLVVGLSDFFSVSDYEMAKRLSRARVLINIANKEGVPVRVFSLARNLNEVRSKEEIFWICKMLGMTDAQFEKMENEKMSW